MASDDTQNPNQFDEPERQQGSLYESYYLGVIGPVFLNQVPTILLSHSLDFRL